MERWKPIPLFENYEASSLGRVRRVSPGNGTTPGLVKVQQVTRDGYFAVNLYVDGKAYHRNVHHLVCLAFHGLPPEGTDQARHKDGSRTNNKPSNLAWTNALGNAADRRMHGTEAVGGKNPNAKLDEGDVIDIRHRLKAGEARAKIAARYGVSKDTIHMIAQNKAWRHVAI